MKKIAITILFLVPIIVQSQIPVTDVATNASVGMVNSNLFQVNLQLKAVNKKLSKLITLMEKSNNNTSKSKNILKEELEAKKNTPNYVKTSTDVLLTLELRKKILSAYHSSKNSIQQLKYLEKTERQEFYEYTAKAIKETASLFKQCDNILKTKDLMRPEERLKKINDINMKLETISNSITDYGNRLDHVNAIRKARISLIELNKQEQ